MNNTIRFITESNRIEGINREPTKEEIDATYAFLDLKVVRVEDLENFVRVCAQAPLRDRAGMDVRVGDHRPPPGGPGIRRKLQGVLDLVGKWSPYDVHIEYETLHPFMDGNGRSGRVLWAWQMTKYKIWPGLDLGFLHAWYYQSLSESRHADR